MIYTDDSDIIKIEILSGVRHYMFDLKYDFTSFSLRSALGLKSIYSKRIYEMLSQHKDEGVFRISVQELKECLKLIDQKTKKEKLSGWTAFANTVLETSKKEINKKSDLSTYYTLHKTGSKYTDIEFHISKKESDDFEKGS